MVLVAVAMWVVGSAPVDRPNAGSVTPAFVFTEVRGATAFLPFASPPNPFLSGIWSPLLQGRVVAGAAIDEAGHRLMIGASVVPSLLFLSELERGFVEPAAFFLPTITIRPALVGVFNFGRFSIRARPALPLTPGTRLALSIEPNVHARVQLSRALVGLEVDGSYAVLQMGTAAVCRFEAESCDALVSKRWFVSGSAIGEWFFNDQWSTALRVRIERSEGTQRDIGALRFQ